MRFPCTKAQHGLPCAAGSNTLAATISQGFALLPRFTVRVAWAAESAFLAPSVGEGAVAGVAMLYRWSLPRPASTSPGSVRLDQAVWAVNRSGSAFEPEKKPLCSIKA